EKEKRSVSVNRKNLSDYIGAPIFPAEKILQGVGIVTGLAWTSMGGATLPVEASKVHNKARSFKLTGKLGQVMKESAEISYSYAVGNAEKYGAKTDFFEQALIHLHVPEGATPKDGPSAGVTMTTALLSLATGKKIRSGLAMTGELTLTGKVLAVGGIREKVIAARRSNIFEVILPKANQSDFEELPEQIKQGVTAHFAEQYQDVAKIVFS
ncbi:MAG: S16 family serine protease, partial [Granulosicoccaceae bacterium]